MARGLSPNSFREMSNPYAEKKVIEKEMNPSKEAEIKKIVDKITKNHELYEVVDALLTKYDQAILVPDNELEIISQKTDYSVAVVGSLLNKIEKDKKEKREKMN